ncbi:MAG: hypothetical protein HZA59_00595 [Hydrogenophilales bacterium]|nr:hypothetical protein [Hydrogenophilales bacterium]
MIKKLLLLTVFLALWIALLWFAIGIDIAKHGNVSLVAIHLLPPLAVWAGWLGWRAWRARTKDADQAAEAEAKRATLEKQRAERRAEFDNELAERRARVDFRWLQVRDVSKHGEAEHLAVSTDDLQVMLLDEEIAELAAEAPAAWPGTQLTELFTALSVRCPAALTFPVYVLGPSERAFADLAEMVRVAREAAVSKMGSAWPTDITLGAVLGLQQRVASPQDLIDLCATQPELPGAVVLAFESPHANQAKSEESNNAKTQREQWFGKAGQALVGMLLTSPALPGVLAQLDEIAPAGADDVMTPYWERAQLAPGMITVLAPLPTDWRETLATLPTLAQLRRPAWVEMEEKMRPMQVTQNLRRLLDLAGINAALIEPHFKFGDEAVEPSQTPPLKLADSAWLVHNAGGIAVCGSRLAGVGLALSEAGLDLAPVNEGTNVVVHAGDCGRATPYLMLGLAAAKAAKLQKPVLVTHFQTRQVAMSFVLPASA